MSHKSHTADCGYTVTGHAHNCSCPAGDDEATPETDAFYTGPCKHVATRRQRNFARRLERERNH